MIRHDDIILRLEKNRNVFKSLFESVSEPERKWKPRPEKWCLLEILCHLYDEEREDFRARVKHTLETPEVPMPKIDPQGWVTERNYIEKSYDEMLQKFLDERTASVEWLRSLESPPWKNVYHHPTAGDLSAELFLYNWLAHDYLHFRQITFTKYQFLASQTVAALDYAGTW